MRIIYNTEIKSEAESEVIDFERKGNLIRLYLGRNGEQRGDDWDDTPYDCNAGRVYNEYISSIVDICVPYDYIVLEPRDTWNLDYNCGFCKEDIVKRKVPCLIIVPPEEADSRWNNDYSHWVGNENVKKIYFGDKIENVIQ